MFLFLFFDHAVVGLCLIFVGLDFLNFLLGAWQKHVQEQVRECLTAMFNPAPCTVGIKFVRHSPGRRRNSELTMYDVACETREGSELVRSTFAKYRHRENPVTRPPLFADINIHPMVLYFFQLSSFNHPPFS
jgi:hypothetical protein